MTMAPPDDPSLQGTSLADPVDEFPLAAEDTSALAPAGPEADGDPVVVADTPGRSARARRRRHNRRMHRLRVVGYTTVVVLLVAAIPVLAYVGFDTIAESHAGTLVHANLDPAAPGYEAVVEHTPVELVVQVNAANQLVSLTVLSLAAGDQGGGVLFVPTETTVTNEAGALDTLAGVYAAGGIVGVRRAAAALLDTSFDDAIQVGDERLGQLVAPITPLQFDNPDDVSADNLADDVQFAAGSLALDAGQVGPYLEARNRNESDLARLVRQQGLWTAWIDAIHNSADPGVVPGEVTSGIGRFLRGLAAGAVQYAALPVEPPSAPAEGAPETFTADVEALQQLLADLIPFPTSPAPGDRIRVRLLDGAQVGSTRAFALRDLVVAGGEIAVIGNAESFDNAETSIVYYDPINKDLAETIRDALGLGSIELQQADSDTIDVTVILGSDYARAHGASASATTATTAAGGSDG
jgi:hypothetical protein